MLMDRVRCRSETDTTTTVSESDRYTIPQKKHFEAPSNANSVFCGGEGTGELGMATSISMASLISQLR